MQITIELNDILEELELQSNSHSSYLNLKTGELVLVAEDDLHAAGYQDDVASYPKWRQDKLKITAEILETDHFVRLPSQYDIHEYKIMEDFCQSVEDESIREAMIEAIKGKGAFRRFKDNILAYGIEDEWFGYRNEALRSIAIEWCENNDIAYTES